MSSIEADLPAGARAELHLEVRDLRVHYDGIQAVHGVSFSVARGELVTLIGANGAGKTSILRAISGLVPYGGTVNFAGRNLQGVPAHRIVGFGMAHVPEGRGIFGNLTVRENLRLSTWQRRDRDGIATDLARVLEIFPRLRRANRPDERNAVGWRATDAGRGSRADEPRQPAVAR